MIWRYRAGQTVYHRRTGEAHVLLESWENQNCARIWRAERLSDGQRVQEFEGIFAQGPASAQPGKAAPLPPRARFWPWGAVFVGSTIANLALAWLAAM